MLLIVMRTWGLALLVGALGALLGYGLALAVGQAGWALVGASIGLCGGAVFAGSLMNPLPAPASAVGDESPTVEPTE